MENLTGALVLGGFVFFHRHLSATSQCNDDVEHRTGVGARQWRQEERSCPGSSVAAQLELEVRAEGRNMRNTSAPSVWEEEVVWLQVTHKCSCASHPWAVSHCKRHWLRELGLGS